MTNPKLIAANWKMNGRLSMAQTLMEGLKQAVLQKPIPSQMVICPPYPYLGLGASILKNSTIALGAQDCSQRTDGAYTGEVSAAMLKDMGCSYVILGHSERREYHGESDSFVAAKVAQAHKAGLKAILCVGEKDPRMNHEERVGVLKIQLRNSIPASANEQNTVIAYEPIWAIGTGVTPTTQQINDLHKSIRELLPAGMCHRSAILYGGSVNAKNAGEILALSDVDGALVGGASLKLSDFLSIANLGKI